jgi:hypothetical protein
MSIDTKVQEQMGTIAAFQQTLATFAGQLGTWSDDVAGYRQQALGSWTGQAADAFGQLASKQSQQIDQLAGTTSTLSQATDTFYDSVWTVSDGFQSLREQAAGGGLQVSGTDILEPQPPADSDDEAAWAEYERKCALYEQCSARAGQLRVELNEAHETYNGACDDVSAPAGVVVPLTGSQALAGLSTANHVLDWTKEGGEAGVSGIGLTFGRYAPRNAATGQFTGVDAFLKDDPESVFEAANYVSKPGMQSALSVADDISVAKGVVGKVGVAGAVVGGVADGYEQWNEDGYDPSLSESARAARAVTVGASDAGLSIAGAVGGAEAGAAIGAFAGPVGAAVGGVVGGVIGSGLGELAADGVKSLVNTFMRW